ACLRDHDDQREPELRARVHAHGLRPGGGVPRGRGPGRDDAIMIPSRLERTVLRLVREGGGRASWHRPATRLPAFDGPLDPDVMTVLEDLQARGLVTRTLVGGGMDAWAITPSGEALLDSPAPAAGPLPPDELARFARALAGDAVTSTRAVQPHADDGLKLWAM